MSISIKNKKARFEYHLEKSYTAGLKLLGTEIKSIRNGDVNVNEAYCIFNGDELFVKGMFIKEYEFHNKFSGSHVERRERKLLLNRSELDKLLRKVKVKGYTIVVTRLFINDKGLAKLEIALAKGKNNPDKRNAIKERDNSRDALRKFKNNG